MVCVDLEVLPSQVRPQDMYSLNNGDALLLSDAVVSLSVVQGSAPITDQVATAILMHLHQRATNLVITGICVYRER